MSRTDPKPRHGPKVQRGLRAIVDVLDLDLSCRFAMSDASRRVKRADVRAAMEYLRRLVEWKDREPSGPW